MIEQELIQIWKSSPQVEQVKFEKSRLMMDVQSSLDRFHKATKRLIFIESMAAIIVMPIFIAYVFVIPVLLSKIASAMIAIWIGYVMYVMRKMKKERIRKWILSTFTNDQHTTYSNIRYNNELN